VRFDAVYVGHFKCNLRRIADYPNLSNYLRDLYQVAGVGETVNLDHIKRHYYGSHTQINPTGIVPLGPQLDFFRAARSREIWVNVVNVARMERSVIRGRGSRIAALRASIRATIPQSRHHRSLTGAPSRTSAMRARVPAPVSPGRSSSAKKPDAAISRLGGGGALWTNERTMKQAT